MLNHKVNDRDQKKKPNDIFINKFSLRVNFSEDEKCSAEQYK